MREMEDRKDLYYIGELAEYFGVSRDTLRLYDKVGILSPKKDEKNHNIGHIAEKTLFALIM